jgi:hypothetical protein
MSTAFFCIPSFAMLDPYQSLIKSRKAEERRQDNLAYDTAKSEKEKEALINEILRLREEKKNQTAKLLSSSKL